VAMLVGMAAVDLIERKRVRSESETPDASGA